MKRCTVCKQDKESEQFYKNPGTSDGLGSQCRSCDAEGITIRRRERKQALVEKLGGKCARCSYARCLNALDFHHKDDNKEGEVGKLLGISMVRALEEARKCELVCANCHREIHEMPSPPNRNRRRRGVLGVLVHGTTSGFRAGCKCDNCRLAWNKYHRDRRQKGK
jgi:hypothetical protein